MTRMMRLLVLTLLTAPGCATVQPWQKGTLSHPYMELTPALGTEFHHHVHMIREGAVGGEGGLGGGCGCG